MELSERIKNATERIQAEARGLKNRIGVLGTEVGRDEAKRGHWDTVKGSLGRGLGRLQSVEMAHRERVRERVVRQYKIGE
jgi:syntaxin 1B/2/3